MAENDQEGVYDFDLSEGDTVKVFTHSKGDAYIIPIKERKALAATGDVELLEGGRVKRVLLSEEAIDERIPYPDYTEEPVVMTKAIIEGEVVTIPVRQSQVAEYEDVFAEAQEA